MLDLLVKGDVVLGHGVARNGAVGVIDGKVAGIYAAPTAAPAAADTLDGLFKHIHGWHHRILTPWAVTGHYMHPLEYLLTATVALVGPLLLGAHVVTVWLWFIFRQWEAAEGHCGYDFPWTPTHFLPLSDGAIHHDAHHERVRGNYAGFLGYVDGVFGTYVRGYREELASRRRWAAASLR